MLSWSDVYVLLERVKELAVIDNTFYEVFPRKEQIINNANERHFWTGIDKHFFDLSELENISESEYKFEEYILND